MRDLRARELLRARILADFRRNLGRNQTSLNPESERNRASIASMNTPRICTQMVTAPDTDYICTLPINHAGDCVMTDAMGMCHEPDCRALRPGRGTNGYEHNHSIGQE